MTVHILPNLYKKIGLVLFMVASLLNGSANIINNSFNHKLSGINVSEIGQQQSNNFLGLVNAFSGGGLSYVIDFFAIIALLIFMMSKEKVEDDYINKLRLESFQLTFIIGLLVTIVIYFMNTGLKLTLNYFIFLAMWSYIIIFFIKRRMYL